MSPSAGSPLLLPSSLKGRGRPEGERRTLHGVPNLPSLWVSCAHPQGRLPCGKDRGEDGEME